MIYEPVGEYMSPATRDVSTLSLDGTDLYTRRLTMEPALFNMRWVPIRVIYASLIGYNAGTSALRMRISAAHKGSRFHDG